MRSTGRSYYGRYFPEDCVRHKKTSLYERYGPIAQEIKIRLQFSVGGVLAGLLLLKALLTLVRSEPVWLWLLFCKLREIKTLNLVGSALAYSAGFELAYMLFTKGPDEAVEPAIMGVAAAMLLGLSYMDRLDLSSGCGAIVLVIALAGLFMVKRRFIDKQAQE